MKKRIPFFILLMFAICFMLASYVGATTIITDPAGDSTQQDIISITGGYNSTSLILTASFSPGSLDSASLGFNFGLDIDLDPDTGVQPPSIFPLGGDLVVYFNSLSDPVNAQLANPITGLYEIIPVSFDQDFLSVIVPLTGGSTVVPSDWNGEALFGLVTGVPANALNFAPHDYAPDSASAGPLAGPTTPVPEPASILLLATGFAGLLGFWKRKK